MTIDLQMVIIEKIKRLNKIKKCADLPCYVFFCYNLVKISVKPASSEVSNFLADCDRITSAALPHNTSELFT